MTICADSDSGGMEIKMSELRQKLFNLIETLPENKIIYFINIFNDLQNMLSDEIDEYDMELAKQADEAKALGEFVSLDEAVKEMGYTLEQLQN